MKVFWAMRAEELERFYAFREAEARVRRDLSSDLIKEIRAEARDVWTSESKPYTAENGVANIAIEGTLEPKRTLSSSLYGETTTYGEIEEATRAAEADPLVEKIRYSINSHGGNWDGVDYCAEVIKQAKKPTEAVVYTGAHSAGYYLASQTGKVYAATKGSSVGSIGVAAEYFDREMKDEKEGIKRRVFTNTESADKRPKAGDPEGAAVIQEQLDQYYRVFENRVIEGRLKNVALFTAENIRQLRGRSVLAEKALEIGLIDGILSEMAADGPRNNAFGERNMKLQEFLASNAEAQGEFNALVEKQAAEKAVAMAKEGAGAAVAAERGRILEIFSLSGAKISDETKKAVETGADAGEYAKTRLHSLSGSLNTSNAGALGAPNPEPKNLGAAGEVSLSEDEIRKIGKMAGGGK
ncbi:MAG: S49 family peptidase [Spirochaetaceae bacterium]|jgi:ClpP class serine protease|nr:S49 family peptidase [Spirochaetaceae bacterium]